ncbi:DoxX family protein [Roseivirga sp.]|uniref:DoxX family protein n=1 Tax=Roseivirga sp. TaxID=1964215 RepID=UPI003B8DA598
MLNHTIVAFFARVLLGLIFLMQGIGKVFTWGLDGVYGSFQPYEETFLPKFSIVFAAYYTSYAELIGGALLVLGLFKNYALYALALVLLIVSFGHGLSSPIWDLNNVMWRAVLLIFLLVIPKEWDKWQIEHLLKKKKDI